MHVTQMHFAFLKAANPKTAFGKRVLAILTRQHEEMVYQQEQAAIARAKRELRLATSLDAE